MRRERPRAAQLGDQPHGLRAEGPGAPSSPGAGRGRGGVPGGGERGEGEGRDRRGERRPEQGGHALQEREGWWSRCTSRSRSYQLYGFRTHVLKTPV